HQRRRAAAEEDRGQPAARCLIREMVELGEQRAAPARLVDLRPHMAVEVAIGAFRPAERPVHIKREARVGRRGHRGKQRATSLAKASAWWLMPCFSAASISPKVRSWPTGWNMGS